MEITNISISDGVVKEVGPYLLEKGTEYSWFEKYKSIIKDLTGNEVVIKDKEVKETYKRKISESIERANKI